MWSEQVTGGLAAEHARDLRAMVPATRGDGPLVRLRARMRRIRGAGFDDPVAVYDGVTIRRSHASDRAALRRLAEGELLVAEVDGELRAALPLAGGGAIADPFRPTAPLVSLLGLRAAQIRATEAETTRAADSAHAAPLYVPHRWSAR